VESDRATKTKERKKDPEKKGAKEGKVTSRSMNVFTGLDRLPIGVKTNCRRRGKVIEEEEGKPARSSKM